MVAKTKKKSGEKGKKGKIKVLNLKKETVKDLTDNEAKRVRGGTTQCIIGTASRAVSVQSVIRQTMSVFNSVAPSY